MTQPNIQALMGAGFNYKSTSFSSDAYASVKFESSGTGIQPIYGSGDPCHFAAVYSRTDPSKGAVYNKVSTNNTQVPAGLDTFLTDDYILFWISAAYVTNMPQGALFNMLNANGGGAKLHEMEILSTSFACGTACGMVYMMATVPGPSSHGIEKLELRRSVTGQTDPSGPVVYSNVNSPYLMLLELMWSSAGFYTPVEIT